METLDLDLRLTHALHCALIAMFISKAIKQCPDNLESENKFIIAWINKAIKSRHLHKSSLKFIEGIAIKRAYKRQSIKSAFLGLVNLGCSCGDLPMIDDSVTLSRLEKAHSLLREKGWVTYLSRASLWKETDITSGRVLFMDRDQVNISFTDDGKYLGGIECLVTHHLSEVMQTYCSFGLELVVNEAGSCEGAKIYRCTLKDVQN